MSQISTRLVKPIKEKSKLLDSLEGPIDMVFVVFDYDN